MIGVKKNVIVFFGLFLVGMLFVPTGIPFMDPIPEAEAVSSETVYSHSEIDWQSIADNGLALSIFVDDSGYIWVGNRSTNYSGSSDRPLLKLDSSGNVIFEMSSVVGSSNCENRFGEAHSVVVTSSNIFIFTGSGNCIVKYDISGNYIENYGSFGSYQDRFQGPLDMDIDSAGNLWIADSRNYSISKWYQSSSQNTPSGSNQGGWSGFHIGGGSCYDGGQSTNWCDNYPNSRAYPPTSGNGDNEFENPRSLAIDSSDNIFVLDDTLNRVQKFSSDGTFLTKWGGFSNPIAIAVGTSDEVYVLDAGTSEIKVFTNSGSLLTTITSDGSWSFNSLSSCIFTCMATGPSGKIYVVDNTRIHIFEEAAAAAPPSGTVTISSQISLLACDPGNVTNDGYGNLICGIPDPTGGDCTQIGTWDVSTKTCTLTADVIVTSSGNGIYVGQNQEISTLGITIDGAGHTITGPGTEFGNYGVWLGQTAQITVKNLVIENFYYGIRTSSANGITITGNTVSNTGGAGIHVYSGSASTGVLVSNNTVQDSGGGITVQNFIGNESCSGDHENAPSYWYWNWGNTPYEPYPVIVKDNTITGITSGTGVSIDGRGICVDGNTITNSAGGINISGIGTTGWYESPVDDNNIISNNVITSNVAGAIGIKVLGDNNTIDSNTTNDNTNSGFSFDSRSQNNIITNNVANNNGQYGFYFGVDSTGHTFTGNTASGNGIADFLGVGPPSGTVTTSGVILNTSDGGDCSTVGTWTLSTRTCTLTADVNITPAGEGGFAITSVNPYSGSDVGIILDGDGHTITGAGISGESFGVRITGQSEHVTIKDLTIKNFQIGIKSVETDGLRVSGVTVDSVGDYAMYIEGDPSIVTPTDIRGNTVKNSDSGIRLFDIKIDYVCASGWFGINILSNTIQNIGNTGIGLSNSDGACVKDNTIEDSTNSIAVTNTSHDVRIENNVITDSTSAALYLQGAERIHIKGNTITGDGEYGGFIRDEGNNHNFQIYDNSFQGMTCNNSDNGRIVGNTISDYNGSAAPGIFLSYCDHVVIDDNTITNNGMGIRTGNQVSAGVNGTFTSNTITNNDWLGMYISGSDHVVSNNIVNNNGGTSTSSASPSYSGIIIYEASNITLTGNTANNNNQCGIYVSNQGHTVSGNTATGNNPSGNFGQNIIGGDLCGTIAPIYPPTVTVPADITIAASTPSGTTVTYSGVTATDNVSVASGPTCDIASGTNFAVGTTTVICSATDNAGNVGSATFTVTVTFTDITPPTITVPDNISSSSISESGMAVTYTNTTATDNVAVTTGPTCDPASGSTFPIGTTTVTCTASDAAGLTVTDSFTVTLAYTPLDNQAPTITVPSTITVTTSNSAGAAATFSVTASDNVGVTTGPTCGVTSGSNFAIGDTMVTCTASDAEGNTATETFTVTVQLASPPAISIPHDTISYNVNTGVFATPVYYPNATATSSIGIASGPTCTPSSNSAFSVGSNIVTCTATDSHGTVGTSSFSVVISQQPALTDSECQTAAGSGHDSNSLFVCEFPFNVTIEENQRLVWVDTQPWQGFYRHSITSSAGLFDHGSAGVMDMLPSAWGGVGTYSFYDKLNPSLTGSITIAESDNTNPTVTVPSDMTVSTESPTGTPTITYSVSASDDREVTSGPTCSPASGSNFSVGTTLVTCSASDAAGNTGTSSFTVTVEYTFVDETPPGLVPPSGITLATTNPSGTVVTYTGVTATDNVAVTDGPTCTPASGTMFPIGITEVTCTAYDEAGNEGSTSFTVTITQTIIDSSAPAITVSNNISQTTTSSSGKIVSYQAPTAVDNVGVTIGPTCTPVSGYMFSVGITTVSCSASDAAGNTATASFTVTITNTAAVGDNIPPTLSQQSTIVQDANLSNGAIVAYSLPTATDNTAVTYGPSCTPFSGSLFSIGTTTVTCIAKDAAGNQGSVSFNVIVIQPVAGEDNTVTLQLGKSSYFTGDSINITGVATGDAGDVLLAISAPNGDIISINQITPGSVDVSQSSGTQTTVQNSPGSSFEGCEPNCFLPNSVSIDAGGTVTWENPDNVPHTVTSGSPFSGPDGYFNSSLISAGSLFSHQFNASGTYDYYCIVHPWMQGSVVVSGSSSAQPEESGSFTTEILTIGPLWSQEGSYTVNASYGPAAATKTFNFTVRDLDAIPFTSVPSDIALSINKNNYTGDETISINAALIGGSAGQPISIEISDPVGVPLFLQTVNTDSEARINSQFTLPENVVSGTYTVSVSSKGELWDLTDSAAFTGTPSGFSQVTVPPASIVTVLGRKQSGSHP